MAKPQKNEFSPFIPLQPDLNLDLIREEISRHNKISDAKLGVVALPEYHRYSLTRNGVVVQSALTADDIRKAICLLTNIAEMDNRGKSMPSSALESLSYEEKIKVYSSIEHARRMELLYDNLMLLGKNSSLNLTHKDVMNLLMDEDFVDSCISYFDEGDSRAQEIFNLNLRDFLKTSLDQDFCHLLPRSTEITLKLPPEQIALFNDILRLDSDKLYEKYGAFGDDKELLFEFSSKIFAVVTVVLPESTPAGSHGMLKIGLFDNVNNSNFFTTVSNADSICGSFKIKGRDGIEYTMTIEEDEKQRRVGNEFIYTANTTDMEYTQYNGQVCTVLRELSPNKECEPLCGGLMYEVKFQNGAIENVFDEELSGPIETLDKAQPLDKMLEGAKTEPARTKQAQHDQTR